MSDSQNAISLKVQDYYTQKSILNSMGHYVIKFAMLYIFYSTAVLTFHLR